MKNKKKKQAKLYIIYLLCSKYFKSDIMVDSTLLVFTLSGLLGQYQMVTNDKCNNK